METPSQKRNRKRRESKARKNQAQSQSQSQSQSQQGSSPTNPSLAPSSPSLSNDPSLTSSTFQSSTATESLRSAPLVVQAKAGDMVARPGYGTGGDVVEVYANVFRMKYGTIAVHQYDVDVQPCAAPSRGGRGRGRGGRGRGRGRAPAGPPRVDREDIQAAVKELYRVSRRLPQGSAFDGRKNIYIPGNRIQPITEQVSITVDGERKAFKVAIAFAATVQLSDVRSFLNGLCSEYPSTSTMALDVALHHAASMKINNILINRAIFANNPSAHLIGPGIQAIPGYTQSARPCQLGLVLNMNSCFTPMIKEETVASLIGSRVSQKMRKTIPLENAHTHLTDEMYARLSSKVNKLKAKTTHSKREQFFKLAGFADGTAADTYFRNAQGERVSVAEHFRRCGTVLKYPHLRLVKIYKGKKIDEKHTFPPECIRIRGAPFKRALSDIEKEYLIKAATQKPNEKKAYIEQRLRDQLKDPMHKTLLKAWGLEVNPEMEVIPARVLPAPILEGGCEARIDVDGKGYWDVEKFHHPAELKSWAVVNFCHPVELKGVKEFFGKLINCMKAFGMTVVDGIPFKKDAERKNLYQAHGILKEAAEKAEKKLGSKCQIIIAIMPTFHETRGKEDISTSSLRNEIKIASDQLLGIPSQCMNATNAGLMDQPANNLDSYIRQITQKINTKLGGHTAVLYDRPVGNPSCIFPKLGRDPFIVLGMDLTHPSPRDQDQNSVIGLVASMDNMLTTYACRTLNQKPDLSTGREVVHDLKEPIKDLLLEYYRRNNGQQPRAILMYRDGVSQGEYAKVIHHEFQAIRDACSEMGDPSADYCPPIAFIVVQKRHHMRFIPKHAKDAEASGNVPPGLCVDSHVCHPQGFDFYLNSHSGIQGTSRPTLYSVLVDQVGFNADELQRLTYWMCHLYCRCTRSVSYCPPAYYAHHAAERGKLLLTNQSRTTNHTVHPNIMNEMFFV